MPVALLWLDSTLTTWPDCDWRPLDRIAAVRGAPRTIRADNGPECVSKRLDQWASAYRVTPDFSRPGKPVDNTLIEAFNGTLRRECLSPR
jgi:putative transposase